MSYPAMPTRKSEDYFAEGPYVVVATLCERILQEGEPSGLLSVIRIIERMDVRAQLNEGLSEVQLQELRLPEMAVGFQLLLVLRGFPDLSETTVSTRFVRPSGIVGESQPITFRPGGPLRAANLKVDLGYVIRENGIHLLEVTWGDRVLTRIPVILSAAILDAASFAELAPDDETSESGS